MSSLQLRALGGLFCFKLSNSFGTYTDLLYLYFEARSFLFSLLCEESTPFWYSEPTTCYFHVVGPDFYSGRILGSHSLIICSISLTFFILLSVLQTFLTSCLSYVSSRLKRESFCYKQILKRKLIS